MDGLPLKACTSCTYAERPDNTDFRSLGSSQQFTFTTLPLSLFKKRPFWESLGTWFSLKMINGLPNSYNLLESGH